jgi:hypothetical protein
MKYRAERDGKCVVITGDVLSIDGKAVFFVKGWSHTTRWRLNSLNFRLLPITAEVLMQRNAATSDRCSISLAFFCLQQHWLSDDQISILGQINDKFSFAGTSGFDGSDVSSGRPFGGCAILWRSDLSFKNSVVIGQWHKTQKSPL